MHTNDSIKMVSRVVNVDKDSPDNNKWKAGYRLYMQWSSPIRCMYVYIHMSTLTSARKLSARRCLTDKEYFARW